MSLSENRNLQMFTIKRLYIFFSLFFIFSLFTGCVSQKNTVIDEETSVSEPDSEELIIESTAKTEQESEPLTLLFAGDIMDHKPNYNMPDFNDIYADIKPIVQNADLSFLNKTYAKNLLFTRLCVKDYLNWYKQNYPSEYLIDFNQVYDEKNLSYIDKNKALEIVKKLADKGDKECRVVYAYLSKDKN